MRYNFRYYQNIDQEITVPAGFKPEQLSWRCTSSRKEIAPLSQTFLWKVESVP